MAEINGTCESLLNQTLSEVKKLGKKMVKVELDLEYVKNDISDSKKVFEKMDDLSTGISDIKMSVAIAAKDIESAKDKMDRIQFSQKDQGERMEKLGKEITNVKEGLNVEISEIREQISGLKKHEKIAWTIIGLILTGVIGFVFTFLSRLLPPYYYGYGG